MSQWQRWRNIMKCYPFETKRLAKWEPPYIVQPKYDGVRCRAVHIDSGYILLSSEENLIFSVPHINVALNDLPLNGIELDGELYCHGKSFEEIVSITSRTVNLHPHHTDIKFHCFDVVTNGSQVERLATMKALPPSRWIVLAPFYICNSLDDIMRAYDAIIASGYEGIIVRHYLNQYERKRSTWIMKFKPKKDDVYEIVDTKEEIDIYGNPKDSLGAVICKSGDGQVFSVGTGFTEERRKQLWEIRSLLVGQFAKVQYQHLTDGRGVPRFPVFVDIVIKP